MLVCVCVDARPTCDRVQNRKYLERRAQRLGVKPTKGSVGGARLCDVRVSPRRAVESDGSSSFPNMRMRPNVRKETFRAIRRDPTWRNVFFGSVVKLRKQRSMSVQYTAQDIQKFLYKLHRGQKVTIE